MAPAPVADLLQLAKEEGPKLLPIIYIIATQRELQVQTKVTTLMQKLRFCSPITLVQSVMVSNTLRYHFCIIVANFGYLTHETLFEFYIVATKYKLFWNMKVLNFELITLNVILLYVLCITMGIDLLAHNSSRLHEGQTRPHTHR